MNQPVNRCSETFDFKERDMLYMCLKGACLCPNKRIAVLIVSSNLKAFVVSPLICSSDLNQKYQVDSGVASLPTPQLFAIFYLD